MIIPSIVVKFVSPGLLVQGNCFKLMRQCASRTRPVSSAAVKCEVARSSFLCVFCLSSWLWGSRCGVLSFWAGKIKIRAARLIWYFFSRVELAISPDLAISPATPNPTSWLGVCASYLRHTLRHTCVIPLGWFGAPGSILAVS